MLRLANSKSPVGVLRGVPHIFAGFECVGTDYPLTLPFITFWNAAWNCSISALVPTVMRV